MPEWHDLNARHEATFLWGTAVLAVAVVRSADVRRLTCDILKILAKPSISLPLIGMLAIVAGLTILSVILGRMIGVWETLPVVTASVWFLTAGFSLLLNLGDFLKGENEFQTRVVAVLVPSTVITEIISVAVLTFWWELFLIPLLFFIVYVMYTNQSTKLTVVASVFLVIYALGLISTITIDLVDNPSSWRVLLQAALLPIVLTVGTLPYIQLLVMIERLRFDRGAKRKTISAIEYGNDWPLTVDSAKLCCRFQAVWVQVNGKRYGVNGTSGAILKRHGYQSLDFNDIWKDHPDREKWIEELGNGEESAGWKISIHRLIQDGLALERQS